VSPTPPAPGFRVRFTTIANWLQIPSIQPEAEAEKEKGARLSDAELRELHRRLELARAWLERWAPDEAKFEVLETTPDVELTPAQRRYLFAIKALIGTVHDAGEMQNQLYEYAKKVGLVDAKGKPSQDAFAAIYLAFIGKPNGPRAGWLLLSMEPERVRRRLDDLGRAA
jgi:lysyl-tRNA synthetase class 1